LSKWNWSFGSTKLFFVSLKIRRRFEVTFREKQLKSPGWGTPLNLERNERHFSGWSAHFD
jgi:hypothetical protein